MSPTASSAPACPVAPMTSTVLIRIATSTRSGASCHGSRQGLQGESKLRELARVSSALRDALAPHVASEEEVLTPKHLAEMIPARELEVTVRSIGRANRANALDMASFFAESLDPLRAEGRIQRGPVDLPEGPRFRGREALYASHGRATALRS